LNSLPACLGFDYGLRRVGIAVNDHESPLAFALETHVEGTSGSILGRIANLIKQRAITRLVVGLPLTADGREGDMAHQARRFAGLLEEHFELAVVLWDERFSSVEADRWLKGRTRKKKVDRDAVAAAIILQSYLDRLTAGVSTGLPGPGSGA